MDYSITKKVEDAAASKYEAVIIAAKLARKINMLRLAEYEKMGPEASIPKYPQKVTTEALIELAGGKVKYTYKEETLPDEDIFQQ